MITTCVTVINLIIMFSTILIVTSRVYTGNSANFNVYLDVLEFSDLLIMLFVILAIIINSMMPVIIV